MFWSLRVVEDVENIEGVVGDDVADDRHPERVFDRRSCDFVSQGSVEAVEEDNRRRSYADNLKIIKDVGKKIIQERNESNSKLIRVKSSILSGDIL